MDLKENTQVKQMTARNRLNNIWRKLRWNSGTIRMLT